MADRLLETKYRVPARRLGLVERPRLNVRLAAGLEAPLMLVSAPAGFGKTTLLVEWLATAVADGCTVAWLSLDSRDNDPAAFWAYLATAIESAAPGVGAAALSVLQSPGTSTESAISTLLGDLGEFAGEIVLILDDFHAIEAREVNDGIAFLLENLPAGVHLVIASRADPSLQLAKLRSRGGLVEIRATDLRFTEPEVVAYLNEQMGLGVAMADVATLGARTEGWIAALQMAALAMRARDDVSAFVADFAGDDRYIVDYLVEEVLQRQSVTVRDFLLHTSILSRLNGPLCDVVTGQDNGRATLESLDRANLFVVALDDRRWWYRYHHLFADVLRSRLLDEQPDRVTELHSRASAWLEENGDRPEAIRHSMAAGDFLRAADLVELALPESRKDRQEATLRRWLEALPPAAIRGKPVLSLAFAGALLANGELAGVEEQLASTEVWLRTADETDPEVRALMSALTVYRAAQASALGDPDASMGFARRALDLVDKDDHVGQGAAAGLLALAHWSRGDLEDAHGLWSEAVASLQKAGHLSDAIGCSIAVADIRIQQGGLTEAMGVYEWGLDLSESQGSVLRGTADMHVGMSEVFLQRNDLDSATQHLLASDELGEGAGLPQNRYRSKVAMALVREAEGDLAAALDLLDQAKRLYVGDFYPDVRPIAALRARTLLALGRTREALDWVRDRSLSTDDELSYVREFEHITLARVRMAEAAADKTGKSLADASRLLERLLAAAKDGGRIGSVIEVLVLQTLAHKAGGETGAALTTLQEAVALGEHESHVRIFTSNGAAVVPLLKALTKLTGAPRHTRRLLAALNRSNPTATARPGPDGDALIEPLSEREIDVLSLLDSALTGPAIARELFVSLNTVRSHTKSIFAKLGVNNRREAVARARDLGVLSGSHPN
jgi:LuxR family maltose regulon positive regulatory protein